MDFWVPKTVLMLNKASINLLGLLVFLSCDNPESLPYYNTPDFTPLFIDRPAEVLEKIDHKIENFAVTNQKEKWVGLDDVKGKVHIANFMFTRCTSICPIMTNHLKVIANAFKDEDRFTMLSFSVTPWMDSIPALREFAARYGIKAKNWHLLTGNKNEIYSLARRSYFAEKNLGYTKDSSEFLHTEHVVLVDPQLRLRGIYNATLKTDILQLQKDIQQLLDEN